MFKIISIDDEKASIPNYHPQDAAKYHVESAKLANKKFDKELRKIKNQNKKVILMCGGSASGKTEFIEKFFPIFDEKKKGDLKGLVFESTLSNEVGAKIKINKILKSGNQPVIFFILPDDLNRCFIAFQNRDRKIPLRRFYETHAGAREIILWVVLHCPEVEINIFQNKLVDNEIKSDNFDDLLFNQDSGSNIDNVELKYYLSAFSSNKEKLQFLNQIQLFNSRY